jgi:hypothetical protein
VAKVGTSSPDHTISLKRLQCVVKNNNKDRSGEGTAHTFCELLFSKAAIKQLFVADVRFRQLRKFATIVGIAGRHCHVTCTWWVVMRKSGRSHLLLVRCRKTKYKCRYFTSTMSVTDVFSSAPSQCLHK